jgi:RHS repeat-associated protein
MVYDGRGSRLQAIAQANGRRHHRHLHPRPTQRPALAEPGVYTLTVWMREDGLRLDRLLLITDTTYIPVGIGPSASAQQVITNFVTMEPIIQVIAYDYDPLYRLTAADYANGNYFHYSYDVAGNRLTQITPNGVNVYAYDANNRLTSVDGTTYTWDNNGNLLSDGQSVYAYDNANRLISLAQGGDTYTFAYNGQGERVQQTINGVPVTYLLDQRPGITQVLADEDNIYLYTPDGARLGQWQPDEWRIHLPDALGSVRQLANLAGEIVGSSSYDPYGVTMASAGENSPFQFAGEARDPGGLTFLRARYLDTTTGRFISHDPCPGDRLRPQSFNGWSYVENNPVNLTDPTGLTPDFPTHCRTVLSKAAYEQCVRSYFKLDPIGEAAPCLVKGNPGCYYGPIPYRAPGYVEGFSATGTVVLGPTWGKEVVYDFATMERQVFEYFGIAVNDSIGLGGQNYVGVIAGFRSWRNITKDYQGSFNLVSGGIGLDIPGTDLGIASTGVAYFEGSPDTTVYGGAWYYAAGPSKGAGLDLVPFIDVGISATYYTGIGDSHEYFTEHRAYPGDQRKSVNGVEILSDIDSGEGSPWVLDVLGMLHLHPRQLVGHFIVNNWINIFDQIHYYSYPETQ